MPRSASSNSTATGSGRVSRRRSLSVDSNLNLLAAVAEGGSAVPLPQVELNARLRQETQRCNPVIPATIPKRCKSENVICTAQGVKFHDKLHIYQTRLDNLMALAANPAASECNALLARKALRYRGITIERRRASN